jgi:hypothetical protein
LEVRDEIELRNILQDARYDADKWEGELDYMLWPENARTGKYVKALRSLGDRLRQEAETRGVEILPYQY